MKPLSAMSTVLLLALATAMITASPADALVTDPLTRSDRTLLRRIRMTSNSGLTLIASPDYPIERSCHGGSNEFPQ